jgi:hypothetical protein
LRIERRGISADCVEPIRPSGLKSSLRFFGGRQNLCVRQMRGPIASACAMHNCAIGKPVPGYNNWAINPQLLLKGRCHKVPLAASLFTIAAVLVQNC